MIFFITTGYMGSGSSAVSDYLSEFKNINNKFGSSEFIFLHCPNGLFDLEDKLLRNNNVIRSDEALKTFREQMRALHFKKTWWPANYQSSFNFSFFTHTEKFIEDIRQFNFNGFWYKNEEPSYMLDKFSYLLGRMPFLSKLVPLKKNTSNENVEFTFVSPELFYLKANTFIKKCFAEGTNQPYILADQLLLPHNIYRLNSYFKQGEAKIIVVERDPRDVFILNKYYWSLSKQSLPLPKDVYEFCKYYTLMRQSERIIKNNVLRIKFEDLVLEYELTTHKIKEFLLLSDDDHIKKFQFFDPRISISNLMVFNKDEKYAKEAKIIEEELKQYLFDFTNYELIIESELSKNIF